MSAIRAIYLIVDVIQAGFEDDSELQTPIMRYAAVSAIEHSHVTPVTDIQWVPDHFEVILAYFIVFYSYVMNVIVVLPLGNCYILSPSYGLTTFENCCKFAAV